MAKRRKLVDLKSARLLDKRPGFMPGPGKNKKACVKAGLGYERKVYEYLAARFGENRVMHGPWIEYEDKEGKGWLQPDILLLPPPPQLDEAVKAKSCLELTSEEKGTDLPLALALEAKLTYTKRAAGMKLRNFYLPCLNIIYPNYQWRGYQVCQNLKQLDERERAKISSSLDDILSDDIDCKITTWHFRPKFNL